MNQCSNKLNKLCNKYLQQLHEKTFNKWNQISYWIFRSFDNIWRIFGSVEGLLLLGQCGALLVGTWWDLASIGWYQLIYDATQSVQGGTGWYLVLLSPSSWPNPDHLTTWLNELNRPQIDPSQPPINSDEERGEAKVMGVGHHNFWSIVLDDLWSKRICRPEILVWSPVLHSPLDGLSWKPSRTAL